MKYTVTHSDIRGEKPNELEIISKKRYSTSLCLNFIIPIHMQVLGTRYWVVHVYKVTFLSNHVVDPSDGANLMFLSFFC